MNFFGLNFSLFYLGWEILFWIFGWWFEYFEMTMFCSVERQIHNELIAATFCGEKSESRKETKGGSKWWKTSFPFLLSTTLLHGGQQIQRNQRNHNIESFQQKISQIRGRFHAWRIESSTQTFVATPHSHWKAWIFVSTITCFRFIQQSIHLCSNCSTATCHSDSTYFCYEQNHLHLQRNHRIKKFAFFRFSSSSHFPDFVCNPCLTDSNP